ncbi:MAG: tRNA (N(6)-L-threonylcarbamoyladenosine(37)-C(2))-methylthiotransferase MtaB [Lachnospiraceae bacterium]|nr:tRNA (N(6)-L-threonylcarbamoyladenosine(37)-C(2))-methylthiotransferase MtaB [Lachnospiraceae bacterium]MDY5743004.1 tRNA (N(6)-L-threonylcarbamoyladenosine(37)-C(2))-methylthiotransferase MtaB [Lachnospiraceae bacterium]
MRRVALHNLGCKVNSYETEAMEQLFKTAGYDIVPFAPGADIYIVNTCTVTNIADRKSRQMLHKAKKMNPEAIVVATGCYVQTKKKEELDEAIDIAVGNNKKEDIIQILETYLNGQKPEQTILDIGSEKRFENKLILQGRHKHTRAYLKIQDGCNRFCSYCIIPYARGRIRSKKPMDVIREVEGLTAVGYQEVVLTGIHLSSYGMDLDERNGLINIIEAVHRIDGVSRIRLGSLEPRIITAEFIERLKRLPKFCPHFHLSLQSGSDSVLARMNRKYTTSEYAAGCELIRTAFPEAALTTDLITGFPRETEEEHHETIRFVDSVDFAQTHIFKYSPREGTKAAVMEGQLSESVKNRRSRDLIELGEKHSRGFRERFLGKIQAVLFEEEKVIDGIRYQLGHTMNYLPVWVADEENLENRIEDICLERLDGENMIGRRKI